MAVNAEKNTEKNDNVRAVARALEILLAFTSNDFELTPAELLKRVKLSRPTLYRLLYTLEEQGFVVSSGEPQRFRLGPAVAKLTHVWTASLDLSQLAHPFLQRIWRETGETVAMFIPQGTQRLCVAELPSPQPLNFKRGVGYTERIYRGASGRAILAELATDSSELAEFVRGADIDLKELAKELAKTRQQGYANSYNELISGAIAIAAPFFDHTGTVAGSIGVFGPTVRLTADKLGSFADILLTESKAFSASLGYSRPASLRHVPATSPKT